VWFFKNRSKERGFMIPRRTKESGIAFLETAIFAPVVIAMIFGAIMLDQSVRVRQAVEWSVGEGFLIHDFWGDIGRGPGTLENSSFTFNFSSGINGQWSENKTDDTPNCNEGSDSRCKVARTSAELIARAIQSFQVAKIFEQFNVTFTYSDLGFSGYPNLADNLKANRMVTIEVSGRKRGLLGSLWPTVAVSRTEAIG